MKKFPNKTFMGFAYILFLFLGGCVQNTEIIHTAPLKIVDKSGVHEWEESHSVNADESQAIKIGLRTGQSEASIQCEGPFEFRNLSNNKFESWAPGKYMVKARDGKIMINGQTYGHEVSFIPKNKTSPMESNSMKVRGDIIAKAVNMNEVNIINLLTVDEYLKGVLPREVVVSWPAESLKVQAVASRTYLVSHLGKHKKDGFDLCSDVHCQVYGGMSREAESTNKAVELTSGEILTFQGLPVGAFFHSNCGGETEQIKAVWGSINKPYLPARKCNYGKADPRYHWSLVIGSDEILKLLASKTEVKGDTLKSLQVKQKSISGRAEFVLVETEKGKYRLSGNSFRLAMGPERVRSTLWTNLGKTNNGYRFEGQGWGHGVGMCQWGAKGQAERNRDYKTILEFYYPNTIMQVWKR